MSKVNITFQPSQIEHIDPADVQVNDTAIREVNEKNEEYIRLVEDLQRGNPVGTPIDVAHATDKETNEHYYELIDGRHRLTATLQAGGNVIPAIVWPEDTPAVVRLGIQLRKNSIRVKQTAGQEGKQYQRIMSLDPDLTTAEIAQLVGQSESVVKDRLKLTTESLLPEVVNLLDAGKITSRNAKELATAGKSLQSADLIEAAKVLPYEDLKKRIKSDQQALKSGEVPTPKAKEEKTFEPKFKFRDRTIIDQEIKSGALAAAKFNDPAQQEAFLQGVSWAVSLDEDTVTEAREKFERAVQERAEKKKAIELEKANKKLRELEGATE